MSPAETGTLTLPCLSCYNCGNAIDTRRISTENAYIDFYQRPEKA